MCKYPHVYTYDGCHLVLCPRLLRIISFTDSFTKPSRTFTDSVLFASSKLTNLPDLPQERK